MSKVASDPSLIGDDHFVPGVEIRWWNAVPIDRAVDIHAERETGGRPDSRRARALESLTLRALQFGPPPDEHWVVAGYTDLDGVERDVRIDWRVVSPRKARTASDETALGWRAYALDPGAETTRRVKKLLFAPRMWLADHAPVATRGRVSRSPRRRRRRRGSGSTPTSRTRWRPRRSRRRRAGSATSGSGASTSATTWRSSTRSSGCSGCCPTVGS